MAYDNTLQLLRSNDGLDQVKQLINKNMTQKERQEILNYLECLGRCDIVGSLPIAISTLIFEYFTPNELCQTRLGNCQAYKITYNLLIYRFSI
jgi:hypothetical protein